MFKPFGLLQDQQLVECWLRRKPVSQGCWSWRRPKDQDIIRIKKNIEKKSVWLFFSVSCHKSSMTGLMRRRKTVALPRKHTFHIFSAWSVMMVVRRVVSTTGPLCQSLLVYLSLFLLLEVMSAQRQSHPHHVAGGDLGREQSCCHPALQREITWSAGGIYK